MSGCHPTEIQKCEMHSIAHENYFGDWICPKCHLERSSEIGELEKPVSPMVEQMQRLEERIKELENAKVNLIRYEVLSELLQGLENLEDHKTRQVDENRKISRRVDELEEKFIGLFHNTACLREENKKIFCGMDKLRKEWELKLDADYKKWRQYFAEVHPKKSPHKCPVCNGKCSTTLKELTCGTPFIVMPCSSCEGKGIVWG